MADSRIQTGSQCRGCGIQAYISDEHQTIELLEEAHREAHRTSGDYADIHFRPLFESRTVEHGRNRSVEHD